MTMAMWQRDGMETPPSLPSQTAAPEPHFLFINKLFINQLSSTVLACDQGKEARCTHVLFYMWEIISPLSGSILLNQLFWAPPKKDLCPPAQQCAPPLRSPQLRAFFASIRSRPELYIAFTMRSQSRGLYNPMVLV